MIGSVLGWEEVRDMEMAYVRRNLVEGWASV